MVKSHFGRLSETMVINSCSLDSYVPATPVSFLKLSGCGDGACEPL